MENNQSDSMLPAWELGALFIAIGSLFLTFYIFPYIILGINYEVPHFVIWLAYWYQKNQSLGAALTIFLPLIFTSIIFFLVAKQINSSLEQGKFQHNPDDISPVERFLNQPHSFYKIILMLFLTIALLILLCAVADRIFSILLT